MAFPALFWIELVLGIVLLFLTAKAHGRQIRLERELEGYMEVDFMGENPPWVEALWRKDRRRFWTTLPIAAIVLAAVGILVLPVRFGTEPLGSPILGAVLLAGALWPFAVSFTMNGIQSALRLRTALREMPPDGAHGTRSRAEPGPWLASAIQGTILYWAAVGALGAIAILAAIV